MKKIIAILMVFALVAGCVFAADVSAKAKLDGSILAMDGANNISALSIAHKTDESWNPILSFAANGDVAGASFKFYVNANDGNNYDFTSTGWSVWFKPMDMLKVTAGNFSTNLNQETIDWTHTETGIDTYGYALSLNTNGFGLDAFLAPGLNTPWFSGSAVAQTYIKAGYSADFGTVNAMFNMKASDNMAFGAGYKGAFGPVSAFVNVMGYMQASAFSMVRAEIFATTNIEGIGLSLFVPVSYAVTANAASFDAWKIGATGYSGVAAGQVFLGASFKATIPAGPVTPYVYIMSKNWMASALEIQFKPGVTGSVGSLGYEVAFDAAIKPSAVTGAFTFNVPVIFTVNF